MSAPQVCCLLPPPERTDALAAIARTILLIRRRHALDAAEIAKAIDSHPDRIRRAEKRENLLEFDAIARLAYHFGDCAAPILRLLEPAPTAEPTKPEDMIQRAQELLLTAQRMLDQRESDVPSIRSVA